MKTPVVMAAFGTTTRALETYEFIDRACRRRFSDRQIRWAYSSRLVKDRILERRGIHLKHPHQVLAELSAEGFEWAVVQSLHLMSGHEFYRLVQEVEACDIRTSIGLPLLSEPADYRAVIDALADRIDVEPDDAVVFVGHGTDHPSWTSYSALGRMFRERYGPRVHVGVAEQGYPPQEEIVGEVRARGFERVRLIPFMLIAGMHVREDMSGEADSWRAAFEAEGIRAVVQTDGLVSCPGIVEIFCRHIEEAIDVIPRNMYLQPKEGIA